MNYNQRFDIRRIVKYLLGIMCVSFAIAAFIFIIAGGVFWKGNGSFMDVITNHTMRYKYTINSTSTCKLKGIEQINITASDESVRVINTTSDEVKAHFYGKVSTSSKYLKPTVKCYKSGNTLYIKVEDKNHGGFFNFSSNTILDVSIPTYYKNDLKITDSDGNVDIGGYNLKNLDLNLSCGSLNMNNISASNLTYKNEDGNFKGKNIKAQNAVMKSSEGSVDLDTIKCNEFEYRNSDGNLKARKIRSNSMNIDTEEGSVELSDFNGEKLQYNNSDGNLIANNINTKETKLQASEGSIDVKKFAGDLVATNSDGETNVEYEKFNNNVDISASEGTISLKLPKAAQFNVDAHNSEGSISCDFPVTLAGGIKNDDQLVGKVGKSNKKVRLNNLDGNISITR